MPTDKEVEAGAVTDEQQALIASAAEGNILITACGSANDILWGEFADRGIMEPAELPSELAAIPGLDWHAWKMTEEARAALSAAEKVRGTSPVTAENHLGAISNSERDE